MEELMMQALDGTISATDRAKLDAFLLANPPERAAFEAMLRFEGVAAPVLATHTPPVTLPLNFAANVMTRVNAAALAQPQTITAISSRQIVLVIVICSAAMAFSMAVAGGMVAYGSSVAPPHIVSVFWEIVDTARDVAGMLFVLGRALLAQPITWAVALVSVLVVALWMRMVAVVWLPQKQLA
jgi:anti-sigma factor RsiW